MSAHLSLQQVAVRYAEKTIVKEISFELLDGEIGCLLGPSGCGKTTLLRTIAGFEQPVNGTIRLRGNDVASASHSVPPEKRNVGMVFQDYALFPHLTIEDNIAFGLTRHKQQYIQQRVSELLTLIGLSHTEKRYPHQLSGGQQQRVALARALAPKPDILLLDEPFSNLDVELREQLAHDIRELIKAEGVTAILVTHDQQEAFATADKIGLLNDGKLVQWGTADELYNHPNSIFTAGFIGQGVLISGEVKDNDTNRKTLQTSIGDVTLPLDFPGTHAQILIRPDHISLAKEGTNTSNIPCQIPLAVTLISKSFRGGHSLCTLQTRNQQTLVALLPTHSTPKINSSLLINIQLNNCPLIFG